MQTSYDTDLWPGNPTSSQTRFNYFLTTPKRPVRYVGLEQKGELIAAVPLWGNRIVARSLRWIFIENRM